MDFIRFVFAFLIFWKYFFEKDSIEKDLKIYHLWKHILMSNVIWLVVACVIFAQTILKNATTPFVLAPIVILFFLNICFEFKFGFKSFSKIKEMKDKQKKEREERERAARWEERKRRENEYQQRENAANSGHAAETSPNSKVSNALKRMGLPIDTKDFTIIRDQYRKLAKELHPDMPNGDHQKFLQLQEDYEYLTEFFECGA